jgi:hypothetical protein
MKKKVKLLLEKELVDIKNVIEIQSTHGNWDYDPYNHGMLNGMLLIQTILTKNNYRPRCAPRKWIRNSKDKVLQQMEGNDE